MRYTVRRIRRSNPVNDQPSQVPQEQAEDTTSPQGAPEQPAEPVVAPTATPPVAAPSFPSTQPPAPGLTPQKSRKPLTTVLIVLGVIVLLAIIGIVVYMLLFYVSKADYKHAEAQTNAVITAYNKVDTTSSSYSQAAGDESSTDAQLASKKADYDAASKSYQEAVTSLGNERALKNSKVKAAYDAFLTKSKAFVANNDTMEQTMSTLHKVAVNCSESKIGTMDTDDLSKLVDAYDKAMGPCTDAMKDLANSKNPDAATVGKKAVSYFTDMRTHIVAMQADYIANDRTAFENEYSAFLDGATSFSSDTDITSIQSHQDSLSPESSLNHLASVLQPLE